MAVGEIEMLIRAMSTLGISPAHLQTPSIGCFVQPLEPLVLHQLLHLRQVRVPGLSDVADRDAPAVELFHDGAVRYGLICGARVLADQKPAGLEGLETTADGILARGPVTKNEVKRVDGIDLVEGAIPKGGKGIQALTIVDNGSDLRVVLLTLVDTGSTVIQPDQETNLGSNHGTHVAVSASEV